MSIPWCLFLTLASLHFKFLLRFSNFHYTFSPLRFLMFFTWFNEVGFPFSENMFQHDKNTRYCLQEYRIFSPVLLSAFLLPLHSLPTLQRYSPIHRCYSLPEDKYFRTKPSVSVSLLLMFFLLVCTFFKVIKKKKNEQKTTHNLFQNFWLKNKFGFSFDTLFFFFLNIDLSKKSHPLLHLVVLYTVTTQSEGLCHLVEMWSDWSLALAIWWMSYMHMI